MQVRRLLLGVIALTLVLVAMRLVLIEVRTRHAGELDAFQFNVERIARDSASLLVLSQDFLLHNSPSASRRWFAVHANLTQTLPLVSGFAPDLQDEVQSLADVARGLPALFEAIVVTAADPARAKTQPRMDMLADHLVSETHRISDGAFDLAEKLVDLRRAQSSTVRHTMQLTMLAFTLMILGIGWLVWWRLLRPLAALERAAQAVRSGELDARTHYQARDEFGRLARTFDDMAAALQERSANLEAARRDLHNILDAVPSVIGYCDSGLCMRFANHACETWFGIEHDALQGMHMSDVLGAGFELGLPLMQAALRGEPQAFERTTQTPSGGQRHAMGHYQPDVVDGEVRGFYILMHDVTQQKAYEASLREAMHKARQASTAKSQFLANMSHEIRTPMNAVIGLSYLLGQTSLAPLQADFLAKIKLASKSLLALINDILDLSKVEAGELVIEQAPFKLSHLLKDLADVMAVHADDKGIAFKVEASHELPGALVGDATRLNQVLTNLLANAIKFTEAGSVTLAVRKLTSRAGYVRLRFNVKDSGIGIAPEVQSRLFAPFAQADASTTRRFGGTGLGLSIVKRLATLMGGDVGLKSTPGVGSEFSVELEFALAPPEVQVPHQAALLPGQRGLPGVRVLVADDSDINLEVARRILELEGAVVTLARNGEQAFDRVRAAPQGFDVVLMDVQMPVLDGYQTTRCIRSELGLSQLPIIAFTADVLARERQRAAHAGMNDFITKPFDPQALVQCIRRHLSALPTLRPAPAAHLAERVAEASAWPQIEGIDAADAAQRLAGDRELFRSILEMLLEEFGDLAPLPGTSDAAQLSSHAMRLHKLKGSAGTVGAITIQGMAGEAEAACRAGDATRAAWCTAALAAQLQALRGDAAAFLGARAADAAASSDDDARFDPQALIDLAHLLRQRSLAALDQFGAIATPLRRHLGKSGFDAVQGHIDQLRFDDAARALEAPPAV